MVQNPKNLNKSSREEIQKFLESFDTVLTDCDGVLWMENEVIEGSQHVINKFVELKKNLYYVTNNNSKTREEYAEKCSNLGFTADKVRELAWSSLEDFSRQIYCCQVIDDDLSKYSETDLQTENIICTSYLAAQYLKSLNFNKKVYVLGTEGIIKELKKAGIQYTDIHADVLDTSLETYIQTKLILDPEVGAVLQGFDPHISYPKIMKAATYLNDPNVHFIATCPDENFPASSKLVLPGTGSLLKCLEAATGRKAFVLGKPNDYLKAIISKKQKLNPSRTLMIGDRCNTDILFGKRCGFQTLLVMTGVTSVSDIEKFENSSDPSERELVPEFYINKLGDLLPYM